VTQSRISTNDAVTLAPGAWAALDALGQRVDEDLTRQDVRLTMGGEPTFVAASDPDALEWSITAIGPTKPAYADALLRKLRARFAPQGLMLHGRGKQYPGETSPRWAYSLFWRRDGKPIWRDATRIADADSDGATRDDAERLAKAIAAELGVDEHLVLPAYEPPEAWLLREGALPINIAPGDARLADDDFRASVIRTLAAGLEAPVGFVLPLRRASDNPAPAPWVSERWQLRRGALVLIAGDGPMGDRLPLASLPLLALDQFPYSSQPDPSEARDALPAHPTPIKSASRETAPVRTALTVEARDGKLCVFLPPLVRLEHALELLAAIEDAACKCALRIRLEGYAPPYDTRVRMLTVAPDPGVIEVNVHPAADWDEARDIFTGVYEDARAVGLTAEKFHADGRHVPTGGGDHVVFGAAQPNDSPFLRRPDLLKSMLIYWQRRPSLAYMFSGQFVGPSSQAPRIDEARHEALYELEIALSRIAAPTENEPQPWEIDRLLRNLLADMSGNTHRAEFCIDKLFAPQSATGRLGLLELRAFEMAPNAEMNLAHRALLRALIAWLWRAPFDGEFTRWGTALSDRFMLPHCLWTDFLEVLADLRGAGYPFQSAWFEPHRAFRFPTLGEVTYNNVTITLRQALEPWHVLAEHSDGGGVSRPVDSSLERIEVLAEGFDAERYAIACNGRRLPMNPVAGAHVAGVRYKARKLALGLHPTLPTHLPLCFELFDQERGQCVAEFTYAEPAMHAERPASAQEAAARRRERFTWRAASREAAPPPVENDAEFPMTLDLRRNP
jgi:uncharacterized protein (DUF2126 family)